MPTNQTTTEAIRVMTVCNACRYCEGHCAVFPAMERQTEFTQNNIEFLSNLCHQCGACYQHCQYADPHEFDINVPAVFEQARLES
jgi:citrate/tricarballylate utilization protein